MNTPSRPDDNESPKYHQKDIIVFENKLSDLFFAIGTKLAGKVQSFQTVTDDHFVHRRDRTANDIHLFLELKNGKLFHLRGYTRHMIDTKTLDSNKVLLTGYYKDAATQTGGVHSLKQDWYPWDPNLITQAIEFQNPELFS